MESPNRHDQSNIPVPVNTPETLGVTPRYILQHNAISRSIQNLSAMAKKLTAVAMALLPPDMSPRTTAFTFNDFCKALGISIGGETFKLFKNAATECMQCVIKIETDKMIKGKRKWEQFTWFTHSSFDEETGICTMTFSEELTSVLLDLKKVYAKISLQDLGKLQSKYGIQYFEMAKSYESLQGNEGNKSGYWYFERTIPELREMFCIPTDTYTENKRFRQKVVEEPLKELNAAGVGLEIKTEGIKQGRNLKSIRFDCQKTPKQITRKGKHGNKRKVLQGIAPLELPEMDPCFLDQRIIKEREHLKERYPEEFAAFYQETLQKYPFMPDTSEFKKQAAQYTALEQLREKYGLVP
jgi:plasmid replication initiation protein